MSNECKVAEKNDNTVELETLEKSIARLQKRIDKFNVMYADDTISKEEYLRYVSVAKREREEREESKNRIIEDSKGMQESELDIEVVRTKLSEYLSLKDNMVDRNILNRLVKTIYNREGNEFVWVMNFSNLEIVDKPERIEKFSEEYR